MEITLDEERRQFVLSGEHHVSCMGFDVVYNHIRELERRIKQYKLLSSGGTLVHVEAADIGTLDQYRHYQDLLELVGNRNIGTWFDYDTPPKVRSILEHYRKEGGQIRVFYGDRASGRCWMEENDVMGRVGRSTGTLKIPLLIGEGESGGPGILDSCIVRILDARTREELYRQRNYHLPDMEIRPVDGEMVCTHAGSTPVPLTSLGYSHGVWVREKDGRFANHANFRSYGKAAQWVAFMAGECCEQPE